jgi:hypothetical protein
MHAQVVDRAGELIGEGEREVGQPRHQERLAEREPAENARHAEDHQHADDVQGGAGQAGHRFGPERHTIVQLRAELRFEDHPVRTETLTPSGRPEARPGFLHRRRARVSHPG